MYAARPRDEGIEPSVGSVGGGYDNAPAETTIGLFKAGVIRHEGPWRGLKEGECTSLEWVAWYNTRHLMEPIGYLPPAEYEAQYHQRQSVQLEPVELNQPGLRKIRDGPIDDRHLR